MNLGTIKTEFTQRFPDYTISDAQQTTWANDAAKDIAHRLKINPTSGNINLVAGTREYDLITNFTDFLSINFDEQVQYVNSSGEYIPLTKKSIAWLNRWYPDWKNASNNDPFIYYLRGKYIGLFYTPGTTIANGLYVPYYAKPTAMTAAGDDPFDDRTDLEFLHEGIILYMGWKSKWNIGKVLNSEHTNDEAGKLWRAYLTFIAWARTELPDDQIDPRDDFNRPYNTGGAHADPEHPFVIV